MLTLADAAAKVRTRSPLEKGVPLLRKELGVLYRQGAGRNIQDRAVRCTLMYCINSVGLVTVLLWFRQLVCSPTQQDRSDLPRPRNRQVVLPAHESCWI